MTAGEAAEVGRVHPRGADLPNGGAYERTSITEWEYLKAKQQDLTILAFLLEERDKWGSTC